MKWINVKDELPELHERTEYLLESDKVLVVDDGKPRVAFLEEDHKCMMFFSTETYSPLRDVTHWAPIYMPKEEKGNE